MDPDIEEHYRLLMKQWKKDDDSTKDKLEEIKGKKETLSAANVNEPEGYKSIYF